MTSRRPLHMESGHVIGLIFFSTAVVMLFHLFQRVVSHSGDEGFYSGDRDDHEARRSHPAEKGGAAEEAGERPAGDEAGAESGPQA